MEMVEGNSMNSNFCPTCGRKTEEPQGEGSCCPACTSLVYMIRHYPELVQKLWEAEQKGELVGLAAHRPSENEAELPDVLDGKRYRTIDRDNNKWYLSISEVNGRPVEVFASTAFDRDHELQSRISNLTTITRLISLVLRHLSLGEPLTYEKCLKQIQRSSRQKNDLPDMLFKVLSLYSKQ